MFTIFLSLTRKEKVPLYYNRSAGKKQLLLYYGDPCKKRMGLKIYANGNLTTPRKV